MRILVILLKYLVKLEIVEKYRRDFLDIYYNESLFPILCLGEDVGIVIGIIKEDQLLQYQIRHCIPKTYNQLLKDLL